MKTRILNALTAAMVIGSVLLAGTAPYDEPDIDSPSALLAHGSFGVVFALYLTLAVVWTALSIWQRYSTPARAENA